MKSSFTNMALGKKGEDLVVKHLMKLGFKILERNFKKKWGEIDIIAKKNKILHFIEVKTVSCETAFNNYQPEENVHYFKKKRLIKAIKTYLIEKNVSYETNFQIDVVSVFYNPKTNENKIRILENVLLLF